ncbi:uncharacterized protein B0H64DRAFT_190458 [Chaetomium fimeti]|uniref:Uncharacterized protein n=1 Tax=Chaetomium fimeti TaxID=1854472 RepID=A0AAE0HE21_9PEZI|nr:hypothetical protein B0H64DRAFT_190458 [Chaetomium fimeti]
MRYFDRNVNQTQGNGQQFSSEIPPLEPQPFSDGETKAKDRVWPGFQNKLATETWNGDRLAEFARGKPRVSERKNRLLDSPMQPLQYCVFNQRVKTISFHCRSPVSEIWLSGPSKYENSRSPDGAVGGAGEEGWQESPTPVWTRFNPLGPAPCFWLPVPSCGTPWHSRLTAWRKLATLKIFGRLDSADDPRHFRHLVPLPCHPVHPQIPLNTGCRRF